MALVFIRGSMAEERNDLPLKFHSSLFDGTFLYRSVTMDMLQPRMEAGKNTSTVIPASRKRWRKGNSVVSDETVMYGYEFSMILTTDRLHYKLTDPSSHQRRCPKMKSKAIFRQKKGKRKIWSWAPKGCPTPVVISTKIYSIGILIVSLHGILI
jgi:hypothetical protein